MRSTMPRHRWEAVAASMVPGARLTHGGASVACPLTPEVRAHMALGFAQFPVFVDPPAPFTVEGKPVVVGDLIDLTHLFAERAAGLEFMNIESALSHMATSETEGEQHDR